MGWREVEAARRQISIERAALRKQRDAKTMEITVAWRDGFKALKAENDRMQSELKVWFKDQDQMLDEKLADLIEGAQQ